MSSDQSFDKHDELLAVFTDSPTPSEPRTTAEIAATVTDDRETVRSQLQALADAEELRTKSVGETSRIWWRPQAELAALSSSSNETSRYFETLLSESADYVLIVDEDGIVKYNSPLVEAVLGWRPEDLIGTNSFSYIHPEDLPAAREAFTELMSGAKDEIAVEFRAKHADGSWRWLEVTAVDRRSDPLIDGALLNVRDVDSPGQQQDEITDTSRQLQAVLDAIESAVYMKDTDGTYLLMNETCRELFGVSADEDVSGLTDEALFDAETAAEMRADDSRVFDEETTITVEEEIPGSSGVRNYLTRKTPLFDESGESYALCGVSTDITKQKARESQLKQQRTDLVALNSLNRVFREITDAVLEQPTRPEIEATVCEQLAASESYTAAHLGESEPTTEEITIRAQDGPELLADILDLSTPLAYPVDQCPVWIALRTGTQTVVKDVTSDPMFESWADELAAHDVESFATVPIRHESTQYGVLGLFTDRADAFSPHEQAVLGQLGEVVGHAIATTERQRALLSDEIIELSFRIENANDYFGLSDPLDGAVSYARSVPTGDGGFLLYGTATGDGMQLIDGLVETEGTHCNSMTILDETESETRFELTLGEHPIFSTVSSQAGYIHEAVISGGNFDMTFHYAPSANIQKAIDSVKTVHSSAKLITRTRTVRPESQCYESLEELTDRLTERQLAALEAAYGAGFFNWPRDTSGETLADSLGISPSTYHQHLRKAQQTLMEIVFETPLE